MFWASRSMVHLVVFFEWACTFWNKNRNSYENDRQVFHGPWRSKTEFSLTIAINLIPTWRTRLKVSRSYSMLFGQNAHIKSAKFLVRSDGSVCMLRIGMTMYQSIKPYMRIKKMYTCWGRTQCVLKVAWFRKSRLSWFLFSVLITCVRVSVYYVDENTKSAGGTKTIFLAKARKSIFSSVNYAVLRWSPAQAL